MNILKVNLKLLKKISPVAPKGCPIESEPPQLLSLSTGGDPTFDSLFK